MIRNLFKIAFRNMARNKGFSAINIGGLAIGMASAMLILIWVNNEIQFDAFYQNSDRLYQSWNRDKNNEGIHCWDNTPKILGPTLKTEYPEVEQATRVNWDATILLTVGDKKLNAKGTMVDPDFLTMFRFPFIKGDMNQALNHPSDMVITEKLAKELFGNAEAIGNSILLDNKTNFRVSAVMRNLPSNTQFDFEYLLPWSYMKTIHQDDSAWSRNSTHNFVMLRPHTDLDAFNKKIAGVIVRHGERDWTTQSFLFPVSRLHLYSKFVNGVSAGGKIEMVRITSLIAALILLIACINFMNMSTARSERRAKEVGIRKVSGALKQSLVFQFMTESVLLAAIAGMIALILVQLALPAFGELIKQPLQVAYSNLVFWALFAAFILLTGIVAGSYPAFFLSSFKPVSVLKGHFKKAEAVVTPRKVLVVIQFSFSIMLIVGTIIIERQIQYAQDRETGYQKNNLLYVFLSGSIEKNYNLIRQELYASHIAASVTKTSAPLTASWSSGGAEWAGRNPNDKTSFNYYNTDGGIVKTAGLHLIDGRDIDMQQFPGDSLSAVLNESAVRAMGFKHPIGQTFNQNWRVVGVVKNFILESPYAPVNPIILRGPADPWFNMIHIKMNNQQSTAKNLAGMEKIFKEYNPDYPFEYHFVDEEYAHKFGDEQITATLSLLFSGLTIFISCLGLFGLAAYMAERRSKEIGIRKVLGASVLSITRLLSLDFVRLVLISILVASPIAWLAMNKWLATFPYHTPVSMWIFIGAGAMALAIALLTVSFSTMKAAVLNPVESLKSE